MRVTVIFLYTGDVSPRLRYIEQHRTTTSGIEVYGKNKGQYFYDGRMAIPFTDSQEFFSVISSLVVVRYVTRVLIDDIRSAV